MNNIIGKRIKEERKYKKLTQTELSNVSKEYGLKVHRVTIAKWEAGIQKVTSDNLVILARCFNTTTDYLLGLSEIRSNNAKTNEICDYTGLNKSTRNILHTATPSDRELCEKIIAVICKK